MADTEGTIRFQLEFEPGLAPTEELLAELNAWRRIFRQLGLLGQDPDRYGGFAFGNLSRRITLPFGGDAFVINGTQTSGQAIMGQDDYVTVLSCDARLNRVVAKGPVRPSSESLTHGLLYMTDPTIQWVMHLHSPEIFACRELLGLPATSAEARCGTPRLAEEVTGVHRREDFPDPGLMVMDGHTDGILAYGTDPHETGSLVVATQAQALSLFGS